jgi:hypothetical protein
MPLLVWLIAFAIAVGPRPSSPHWEEIPTLAAILAASGTSLWHYMRRILPAIQAEERSSIAAGETPDYPGWGQGQ